MSYLTQSAIGDDPYMRSRIAQCAAQQGIMDVGIDADIWSSEWRREWSSSPGWDTQWESALARPDLPPGYQPGMDPACISDGQILSEVQSMIPFHRVGQEPPTQGAPAEAASGESA